MFSSILVEASQTFTDEIRHEPVDEADLLRACMSLCNFRIGASKELKDVGDDAVCVGLGDGEEEVEVVSVVEGRKCWCSSCWCGDISEVCLVNGEGEVSVGVCLMCVRW